MSTFSIYYYFHKYSSVFVEDKIFTIINMMICYISINIQMRVSYYCSLFRIQH